MIDLKFGIKPIAILGYIIFLFPGCSDTTPPTRESIIKENILDYFKTNMHDPSSLELIEIQLIDSTTYQENIEYRRNQFIGFKESAERQAKYEIDKLNVSYLKSTFKKEYYENYLKDIEKASGVINGIDSIEISMGESINDIASYLYLVTFRAKNAFGAKVLNTVYVQTSEAPELKVINVTDDMYKLHSSPNVFPGYEELISQREKLFD